MLRSMPGLRSVCRDIPEVFHEARMKLVLFQTKTKCRQSITALPYHVKVLGSGSNLHSSNLHTSMIYTSNSLPSAC